MRIWIVFNKPAGDRHLGLRVKSNYNDKYTEIGIDKDNTIYVDRENSGSVDFDSSFKKLKKLHGDFDIKNSKEVDMEIILDRSSVEAFFFEGMYSMTNLIYPAEN
jgi:sucrose-6-phosphate hydrolase SacC (GH32 family)